MGLFKDRQWSVTRYFPDGDYQRYTVIQYPRLDKTVYAIRNNFSGHSVLYTGKLGQRIVKAVEDLQE